jgi:putative ABC transport system permease protein
MSGPDPGPRRWGARLYGLLLRLYPRRFRERHGPEMSELFERRLARARGTGEALRVVWNMVVDTATNVWALRRGAPGYSRREGERNTMETLGHDIRQAFRHLKRAPGFTLSAVALLAVGLGANVAVFTLVDALLFRPPPWDEPDRVVMVYQDSDDGEPSSSSYPAYLDMTTSDVFEAVSAMSPAFARMTWEGPDGAVEFDAEYATASYLDVVGISPLRGRWFSPEHDQPGAEPVAVMSEVAWRSLLGSDPDVVGSVLRINGQPVRIVGVGPEKISGSYPPRTTDLWLSISATMLSGPFRVSNLDRRQDHWYDVRARLAPGVTAEQAQAAMDALAARLAESFPELNRGRDITVFRSADVRVHPAADGNLFLFGGLLGGVVLTVLLLTCANLANLLLVRGLGRSGEMALRRALGAGRGRVARLFLLESLLLSAAGGVLGLAVARWIVSVLPTLPIPMPGWSRLDLAIDARVGLFAGGLVLLTGSLFGLAPAVRSAAADVAANLREERRGSSVGGGTLRLRNALVAAQVAASLVLVMGAGLLARSLAALQAVDPGVDADRVAWVRADLSRTGLAGTELRVAVDGLIEEVAAIPGVARSAATSRLPAQGGGSTTTVVEDYAPPGGADAVELDFAVVSDGYFETMGIPLVAGRGFGPDDVAGGEPVIVMNETAAHRFWGGAQAALGRRTRSEGGETWRTVVGIVANAPVSSLSEPASPFMYFYAGQSGMGQPYLVARTAGDPSSLVTPLRTRVAGATTGTLVGQGTMAGWLGEGLAGPRFAALLMGGFSALALLLAGLGIYSVVSFSVARRTGELGIRMALGAGRDRVTRMVVREVIGTVGLGVIVGIGLALAVAPRLEGLLFGVDPLDPVGFTGAGLFLLAVGVGAAWIPARRAARTDPVDALRAG